MRTSGLPGCIATSPQPVERFPPLSTSCQVLPPSAVRYRPRSVESLQSLPGTQAYTVTEARGSTRIREMRSDSGSPEKVQVSPASVDLYMPLPIETLWRVQGSPLPPH